MPASFNPVNYCARIARILIFAIVAVLALAGAVAAQKGAVSARKAVKVGKRSAAEMRREAAIRAARYDDRTNLRAQRGLPLRMKMRYYGLSESLADIASRPQPAVAAKDGPIFENQAERLLEAPEMARSSSIAEEVPVQTVTGPAFAATISANFDAVSAAGSAPPDTTMAVGPNHIIVWVNSRYQIFNKSGTAVLPAPVNGNTLFAGTGDLCASTNRGDPILQYDRLADRWILSQFAFNVSGTNPISPYMQCFAVSQTNDPTGAYYRYSTTFSATSPSGFNDYGKLGIWPDGYYTSYNIFGGSPAGSNTGAGVCVSDRAKMLAGDATATTLCAPVAFYGGGASLLPVDLDGPTLPTDVSQGGLFIRQSTAPALRMLKLKPNFAAGTVTLTDGFGGPAGSFIELPLGTTTRACNGTGGTCIAQPGTTNKLDTLGDRLMYRATLRNRGGIESLLVVQSVDPDDAGTRSSAIRWYEIRNPLGAVPVIFQSGTFDEGAVGDRWMGSIAMNKDGDIMMGYSIVNAATGLKPSIALTGRRLLDPINTMQTENIAFTGTGIQTGTLTRWGDYTTMQVDPSDDQTFWYLGQYLAVDGSFNWKTRVVAAKFPAIPSAGEVSVSGRVRGSRSRPLGTSRVTITDSTGNAVSTATDAAGAYRFDGLTAGTTYTITVANRRYTFDPKTITLNDSLTNVDFVATSR